MKRSEELFLAIGGLEAARLEKSEETPRSVKRPKTRLFLIAAVIALAALLVGCAVAVYAKIHTKVTQYDVPTATVSPDGSAEGKNVLTDCYPQALPDGYRMSGGSPIDRTTQNIVFTNAAGQTISYTVSTAERDGITLASAKVTDVTVSGQSGTMQVSEEGQAISWHNAAEGYYAGLYTEDTTVDLQAMADGVAFGQRLPLNFLCKDGAIWEPRYPQQLPDGYTVKQVSFSENFVIIEYYSDSDSITYAVSPTHDLSKDVANPPHDSFVWTDEAVGEDAARMMTTSGGLRILLWENTGEGFYAYLSTMDETVDILAMAEGVATGAPLEETDIYIGPDYSIELSQEEYIGWQPIYPQNVPEGYAVTFVSDRAYGEQIINYQNPDGKFLNFTFYYHISPYGRTFDGAGAPETVDIGGNTGYLSDGVLLWTDESKGYAYSLASDGDLDLVAIARSVGIGPELTPTSAPGAAKALEELGDYRITALPDRMEDDGFSGCPLEDGGGWYAYVRRWYFDKKTGKELFFSYEAYVSDGTVTLEELAQMHIGSSEPAQTYTVQGCPAAGAVVGELAPKADVVWIQGTQEKGLCFTLSSADFTVEELVKIAESVQKQ